MLNFFEKLEIPERPLLGPNIKLLQLYGLLLPKNPFKRTIYKIINTLMSIFIISEYIDIYFIKDYNINLVLHSFKVTMLATVSLFKVWTFLLWQKDWWNVMDHVTEADIAKRRTDNPKKLEIISNYTKYSRKISLFYFVLMYATVVIMIFQPIFKYFSSPTYRENVKTGKESYMQVASSWMPFDKNSKYGYWVATVYESCVSLYGGGWITSYDCNAFVIMVFIRAELELLRIDCADIFGTAESPVSDEIAAKRLKDCHRRHVELIKYVRLLNSCLSPNMLMYMLICSIMLCVTGYQITSETNTMQRFMTAEYLIFGLAQLFIYCWHSTGVFYASLDLSQGPYNSVWWNRSISLRKNLHILTSQLNHELVFTAGPFAVLTMTMCINILKGSYSYYTLLRNSQM